MESAALRSTEDKIRGSGGQGRASEPRFLTIGVVAGAHGLRNGKILILFPEGERTIDGEVKKFKKGAAILSLNVGTPIVPVAIDGAFDVWPRARPPRLSRFLPWSGTRLWIRFGPRLEPAGGERFNEEDYTSYTRRLRDAVAGLMGASR